MTRTQRDIFCEVYIKNSDKLTREQFEEKAADLYFDQERRMDELRDDKTHLDNQVDKLTLDLQVASRDHDRLVEERDSWETVAKTKSAKIKAAIPMWWYFFLGYGLAALFWDVVSLFKVM